MTVFQIYEGTGEWFDLSKLPLERASFSFAQKGDVLPQHHSGYRITEKCIGCRACVDVCPQQIILTDGVPFIIQQEHCERCGNCMNVCPVGAVERL